MIIKRLAPVKNAHKKIVLPHRIETILFFNVLNAWYELI